MKEKIITEIINEMLPALNNGQLKKLKDVLEVNLYNVAIVTRKDEENEPETQDYLEIFLNAKRIEGCSEKTLTYYRNTIHQMMESIGKTVPLKTAVPSATKDWEMPRRMQPVRQKRNRVKVTA